MICEFIDQMRSEGHAVESICRGLRKAGLQIAARTYREWTSPRRAVAARTVSDAEVEDVVRKLVWQRDDRGRRKMQPAGLYGRRKMLAEVRRAGLATASPGAVDRVMRTLGLSGVVRAKKVYTTVADPDVVRAPDLLDLRRVHRGRVRPAHRGLECSHHKARRPGHDPTAHGVVATRPRGAPDRAKVADQPL